jgi:hypothetical protein
VKLDGRKNNGKHPNSRKAYSTLAKIEKDWRAATAAKAEVGHKTGCSAGLPSDMKRADRLLRRFSWED